MQKASTNTRVSKLCNTVAYTVDFIADKGKHWGAAYMSSATGYPSIPPLSARIYSYKPAAQFVVAQTPLETRNKTRVHFAGRGNEKFGYSVGSDFLVMKTCCCRQEKTPRVNFNKISKLSYPRFFRKETFPLKSFHEIFI